MSSRLPGLALFLCASSALAAIHGKVLLAGTPRDPDVAIRVAKSDPACPHDGKLATENWKIGAGQGLADAVIWVETAPFAKTATTAVIDQKGCRYEPHVLCIPAGTTVTFKNSDPTLHNIHASEYRGKNENSEELFNIGETPGMSDTRTFDHAGIFKIRCDVHPWMAGWIIVTNTHCCAVSTADGSFELPILPDGNYSAQAWHSGFEKPLVKTFTVKEGNATLAIEFNASQAE